MTDLKQATDSFLKEIQRFWPFDVAHYPSLTGLSEKSVRIFAIGHMTLHVAKEAGMLARILERHEHRRAGSLSRRDWRRVKKLSMKIIVSGLRLFIVSGGTPEELEDYVMKVKKRPKGH